MKDEAATNDQIKAWKQRQDTYENDWGGSALPAQRTPAALSVSSLILRIEQEQELAALGVKSHGVTKSMLEAEITRLRGLLDGARTAIRLAKFQTDKRLQRGDHLESDVALNDMSREALAAIKAEIPMEAE